MHTFNLSIQQQAKLQVIKLGETKIKHGHIILTIELYALVLVLEIRNQAISWGGEGQNELKYISIHIVALQNMYIFLFRLQYKLE
jgi:hypothetical protein